MKPMLRSIGGSIALGTPSRAVSRCAAYGSARALRNLAFYVPPDQQRRRIGDLFLHLRMRREHARKTHPFGLVFRRGSPASAFNAATMARCSESISGMSASSLSVSFRISAMAESNLPWERPSGLRPLLCDSAGANRRGAAMLRRYVQVMSHGTLAGDTPSGNRAEARRGHNGLILHLRERKR